MRKLLLAIVLIFLSPIIQAQDIDVPIEEIYKDSVVDVKPEFPGGLETFYKVFKKHFKNPEVPGLVDKVVLSFVVEKDGSVTDVRVVHDAGFGTGEQARQILETLPKWLPGTKDGKNVRVMQFLPIAVITEE